MFAQTRKALHHIPVCAAAVALALLLVDADAWSQEAPMPRREGKCGEAGALAELRGRVSLAAGITGAAQVAVFNGQELLFTNVARDGSYCLPVKSSSEGTLVSVFASADRAVPAVQSNVRVTLQGSDGGRPRIAVPAFNLIRSPNADTGYVLGVAYVRVSGGRPVAHSGIDHYDVALKVAAERDAQQPSRVERETDQAGAFLLPLSPGTYRLVTARNVTIERLSVRAGGTTIQPVFSGEKTIF